MRNQLSESDRRLNVESRLLAIVSMFGGQHIVASPAMDHMVAQLADETEALALEGFLPSNAPPPPERPAGYRERGAIPPLDDRPRCTLVPGADSTCYCTHRPGCMTPSEDADTDDDEEATSA